MSNMPKREPMRDFEREVAIQGAWIRPMAFADMYVNEPWILYRPYRRWPTGKRPLKYKARPSS